MTKRSPKGSPSDWHLMRRLALCTTVGLALAVSASAQGTAAGAAKTTAASTSGDDGGYSAWDITPFVGWQWFQAFQGFNERNYIERFNSGWLVGGRVTANMDNHWGLEGSVAVGGNRLNLRPFGQNGFASFSSHNTQVALDLLYNFQPRTAKNRFFIMAGPAAVWYKPGSDTGSGVVGNFVQPLFPFETRVEPALTYGLGLVHYINQKYGLRFDLDGRLNPKAHFNVVGAPSGPNTLYIPTGGYDSSLQATIGFVFREHYVAPPPPPNTAVTQALRVDLPGAGGGTGGLVIAGAHDVCPGDDLRLSVNAAGFPNPTYQWRVNGQQASGATSSSFSAPTANGSGSRTVTAVIGGGTSTATSAPFATSAGHTYHLTAEVQGLAGRTPSYQWLVDGQPVAGATGFSYDLPEGTPKSVSVRVTAPNPAVTSAPANYTIRELTPPTLNFSVNPTSVPYTSGPISLSAVATPSNCGGAVTVRYSGEGVSGSTFNPGSVSGFDPSNHGRQTHTVTITATATDSKGQTVSRTANVEVYMNPTAQRLDDIDFRSMSSRVNNCGKRLLLEELTPMLRNDPGSKVILIGHRDEQEKGRAGLRLDETRVLNAAAVLSAGKGVCPQLDLSRIMAKTAGTDQSSTPRPALCGASVKEKSGQEIKESDKNAEYRRVEVWFIPSGAADPAGVTGLAPVDAAAVQKLGCPK